MPTATTPSLLQTPVEGLLATPPHPLPFAPDVHVRAFVLPDPRGNILVYDAPGVQAAAADIEAAGGVRLRLLGHAHEAMFATELAAPTFAGAADREAIEPGLALAGTFAARHHLDDDLEVIPIPGHTPGSTAYLWDDGRRRFLFTADSVYLRGGEWRAAVLDSSDRDAYAESLLTLAATEFDVLVPWAADAAMEPVALVGRDEGRRTLERIADRLAAGARS